MKNSNKKKIAYIVSLLYIAISIGSLHFGDNLVIRNGVLSFIYICGLLPGAMISLTFGFFGGTLGETIGALITIALDIFIIAKIFKQPPSSKVECS